VDGLQATPTSLYVLQHGNAMSHSLRQAMVGCKLEIGWVCCRVVIIEEGGLAGRLELMKAIVVE